MRYPKPGCYGIDPTGMENTTKRNERYSGNVVDAFGHPDRGYHCPDTRCLNSIGAFGCTCRWNWFIVIQYRGQYDSNRNPCGCRFVYPLPGCTNAVCKRIEGNVF